MNFVNNYAHNSTKNTFIENIFSQSMNTTHIHNTNYKKSKKSRTKAAPSIIYIVEYIMLYLLYWAFFLFLIYKLVLYIFKKVLEFHQKIRESRFKEELNKIIQYNIEISQRSSNYRRRLENLGSIRIFKHQNIITSFESEYDIESITIQMNIINNEIIAHNEFIESTKKSEPDFPYDPEYEYEKRFCMDSFESIQYERNKRSALEDNESNSESEIFVKEDKLNEIEKEATRLRGRYSVIYKFPDLYDVSMDSDDILMAEVYYQMKYNDCKIYDCYKKNKKQ